MTPDQMLELLYHEIGVESGKSLLRQACELACVAHGDKRRNSGDLFLAHPLATAQIVAGWGLGPNLVAMALLHDVLDERNTVTRITPDELRQSVDSEIAFVVEEIAKFSYARKAYERRGAHEEVGKLLEGSRDSRVMLLKLASGLEMARDLSRLVEGEKRENAQFLLTAYGLVARRLGMWQVKRELEDLCMEALFPEQASKIQRWREKLLAAHEVTLQAVAQEIGQRCRQKRGLEVEVTTVHRHIHSLFQRLQESSPVLNITEQIIRERLPLFQAVQLVILTPTVLDCYLTLGVIHEIASPIANSFRDYIAKPKPNGYASLHTDVTYGSGSKKVKLELKIRTYRMHAIAQHGITDPTAFSAWGKVHASADPSEMIGQIALGEENGECLCVEALVASFSRQEKSDSHIRVLTPEGREVKLASGATPLDFAYAIHTELGHHYDAAKVNGVAVPIDYRLRNGEVVEILVNPNSSPDPRWLDVAATSRAQRKIRRWINKAPGTRGHRLLERELAQHELDWSDIKVRAPLESLARSDFGGIEHMLEAIGVGRVPVESVVSRLLGRYKVSSEHKRVFLGAGAQEKLGKKRPWIRMARCCTPSYPDVIVGCVSKDEIVVHRHDCGNAQRAKRRVTVLWKDDTLEPVNVKICVEAYDRPGLARDVAKVVADRSVNMLEFKAQKHSVEQATVYLTLELRDTKVLEGIMSDLRAVEGVTNAQILEDSDVPLGDLLRARPEGRPLAELVKSRQTRGMPNPYSPGRPIQGPYMFYGREREQRSIQSYINPPYQSTSVLLSGQRRIGKTSLVRQIGQQPLIEQAYIPVFVDLEHFRSNNDYQVLRKIGREIHRKVEDLGHIFNPLQSVEQSEDLYSYFQEHIFDLHQRLRGKRILLMLDEFEATPCSYQTGLLSEQFFWALRSWVQTQPLVFIIVGSNRLRAMISQLFPDLLNVLVPEKLGPLEPEDARLLVEDPVRGYLHYEREVVDDVISLSACCPYYIHVMCAKLFSEVTRDRRTTITRVDMESTLKQLTLDSSNAHYYAHLWESNDHLHRLVLSCIASLAQDDADCWVDWDDIIASIAELRGGCHFENRLLIAVEMLYEVSTLEKRVDRDSIFYRIQLPLFRLWMEHNWPLGQFVEEIQV